MTPEDPVRILCIEDNPVNWRLVQRLLTQAGYQMHWASDGLKGYELALALNPALVLLDINLPGLSGFEVATKFRQSPELKGIPLVALTAKTLKSDRETALVAGCGNSWTRARSGPPCASSTGTCWTTWRPSSRRPGRPTRS